MRQYLMEFIGTFFLTIAITFNGNPLAIGLILMAMIYIGGHISGGHYNPAISLTALLHGKLSLEHLGVYVVVQTLGASLALWILKGMTGNVFSPDIAPDVSLIMAILMEIILATALCLVFLTLTQHKKFADNIIYGFGIGLTLTAIVLIGGLFNPAVALSSILGNIISSRSIMSTEVIYIYLFGPLVSSVIATVTYTFLNEQEK